MSFWTFVFLVVIAGMIYSGWRSKHLAQNGAYEDEDGQIKRFDSRAKRRWSARLKSCASGSRCSNASPPTGAKRGCLPTR